MPTLVGNGSCESWRRSIINDWRICCSTFNPATSLTSLLHTHIHNVSWNQGQDGQSPPTLIFPRPSLSMAKPTVPSFSPLLKIKLFRVRLRTFQLKRKATYHRIECLGFRVVAEVDFFNVPWHITNETFHSGRQFIYSSAPTPSFPLSP